MLNWAKKLLTSESFLWAFFCSIEQISILVSKFKKSLILQFWSFLQKQSKLVHFRYSTCTRSIMPSKKKEVWRNSLAKSMLQKDIRTKMILPTTAPTTVYSMRLEYKKWPYKNFVTNLYNLRKKIAEEYIRSEQNVKISNMHL